MSVKMPVEGKSAVVTGAGGTLGLAASRALTEAGASVTLVDADAHKLDKALAELPADRILGIVADVTRANDVERYAKEAVERFGPIDIFFDNAGIEGPSAPIAELAEVDFDRVMAVNVKGVWLGLKSVLPRMRDGGSVIITSSVAGFRGTLNFLPYTASKHAVIGIMKVAALEMAPRRIRVNTIHPSMVRGSMMSRIEKAFSPDDPDAMRKTFEGTIKFGRYIESSEVGSLVLFLAAGESRMITGSEFVIDGGFLL